jgi:vacuolar-type H+-ATPase catalytic subunit A/Vma1
MAEAVKQLAKQSQNQNNPENKRSTQITKAKQPPRWISQTFDKFNTEVVAWNETNKDDDYTKYTDLMESLKKNAKIKEYVIKVVMDNTTTLEEKKVAKIMELLRYSMTKQKLRKSSKYSRRSLSLRWRKTTATKLTETSSRN